ncbi:MAG: hypothetical protein KDJ69_12105 [Nitratireductor sp.]|nr:hypothetical protein [Nitratireductor sp.]
MGLDIFIEGRRTIWRDQPTYDDGTLCATHYDIARLHNHYDLHEWIAVEVIEGGCNSEAMYPLAEQDLRRIIDQIKSNYFGEPSEGERTLDPRPFQFALNWLNKPSPEGISRSIYYCASF